MNTREIIVNARSLIEKGWCQESSARRENGSYCSAWDTFATCWCATGALWKAAGEHAGYNESLMRWDEAARLYRPAVIALSQELNGHVAEWNDQPGRTKEDVIQLFDRVISKLEQEN